MVELKTKEAKTFREDDRELGRYESCYPDLNEEIQYSFSSDLSSKANRPFDLYMPYEKYSSVLF